MPSPSPKGRFSIEMLPAGHGDCLWIEYGDPKTPSRVLIDCGTQATYPKIKAKVEALPEDQRRFDLFVLTHVDADHIGGVIPFFDDREIDVAFDDLWFNSWEHLPQDFLGAKQGEMFSLLIQQRGLAWNQATGGQAIVIDGPTAAGDHDTGGLPTVALPGGMKLTLLSPSNDKLVRLRKRWAKEIQKLGLEPGQREDFEQFLAGKPPTTSTDVEMLAQTPFQADNTPPNGSSIAFLAEVGDKRALLVGDAHPPLLCDSIRKLLAARGEERLRLDAFKLSHHASKANVSNELIQLVDCPRFLISTNGSHFHHPDREAIARVIQHGGPHHQGDHPTLCFNYRSDDNRVWDDDALREKYGYRTRYPEDEEGGLRVEL
jgi:beta-lactamase superfamily II metal-dependent hydrolase